MYKEIDETLLPFIGATGLETQKPPRGETW